MHGEVSGRVTNENGEPLAFCTVSVKGSKTGVSADANGYFKISNISNNSVLVVSATGYYYREIATAPGYLTIALKPSVQSLNEVVVTGFASSSLQGTASGLDIDKKTNSKKSIQTVTVSAQYQPTTILYRIDDKYTLESDGKTTKIGIKQLEVPAIYDYYLAPKIDQAAFLTARIISWQDYDLQSGEVSLYYEGTYLGKTYIDLASTADTLSLSLGKDNGIKVSRKILKEYSSKKFIGANRTDSRQYEISIRNSKRVSANIHMVDQVPVSTNKEIEVEDVKATEARVDKETGIVTWAISLAPGQEKKMGISYSVKYPKDQRLILD
jgi:uncharacterized protein (TIGR02231 family)